MFLMSKLFLFFAEKRNEDVNTKIFGFRII